MKISLLLLILAFFRVPAKAYEDGTYHCDIANRITDVVIKTIDLSGVKMPYIEYTEKAQYTDSVGKGIAAVMVNRAGAKPYESVRLSTYPPIVVAWSDGVLIPGCLKTK